MDCTRVPRSRYLPPGFLLVSLPAALVLVSTAGAATLQVPTGYPRITDALTAAGPGDTVQVAPGTYSTSANGEMFPLVLDQAGLVLLGGGMDATTIDAEQQDVALWVDVDGRVSGFAVTGGRSLAGGAFRIEGGSPEIDHNLVIGNEAESIGSGIFINSQATPWIHHNVVWENTDVDVDLPGDPHGIQFNGGGGLVENNLVGRGDSNGLLVNNNSTPIIRNNIFFENGILTPFRGRGICSLNGAHPIIAYNLFFGNVRSAILVQGGDFSAVEANAISPTDSIFANLDGDPEFIAPHAGDWHLKSTSPAIDAGDPASPLDPDGTPADIGPFYFNQASTGVPDGGAGRPQLFARPNPFRISTTFVFALERPGPVLLAVFDVRGRRVATLLSAVREEGRHEIQWSGDADSGERVPTGLYFVRLETEGEIRVGKVLLLP